MFRSLWDCINQSSSLSFYHHHAIPGFFHFFVLIWILNPSPYVAISCCSFWLVTIERHVVKSNSRWNRCIDQLLTSGLRDYVDWAFFDILFLSHDSMQHAFNSWFWSVVILEFLRIIFLLIDAEQSKGKFLYCIGKLGFSVMSDTNMNHFKSPLQRNPLIMIIKGWFKCHSGQFVSGNNEKSIFKVLFKLNILVGADLHRFSFEHTFDISKVAIGKCMENTKLFWSINLRFLALTWFGHSAVRLIEIEFHVAEYCFQIFDDSALTRIWDSLKPNKMFLLVFSFKPYFSDGF